ncbi:tetratricopeptide repeat protein, partial [Acidobacteriota bacterium]
LQPIERQLRNQRTLIILDNMESILPPEATLNKSFCRGVQGGRFLQKESPLARFEPEVLEVFFKLCRKLMVVEGTCLLFTSREALPGPFDAEFQRVTLSRLDKRDAIELVQQAMTAVGLMPKEDETGGTEPEVEALVEAVNCHARSLVLLAPYISQFGVRSTTENLGRLMAELHKKYPDERERSLFASVELSLRRLSTGIREKIKPLGVFQGGAHKSTLQQVLELTDSEGDLLVKELQEIGLAEPMAYSFFRFHPALCPYLRQELEETELADSTARWVENMRQLSDYLYEEFFKDAQLALNLTTLELPNLVRLLEHVQTQEEPDETVKLATRLEQLISYLGRPYLLAQVETIREGEAKKLTGWSHTRFWSSIMQIDRLLDSGNLTQALLNAKKLLKKCLQEGEKAYSVASYDIAFAHWDLGRVLRMGGAVEAALLPIDEAYRRFQRLADQGNTNAANMASKSLTGRGDCLLFLGRLEEAASAYEEGIKISEELGDLRSVAVKKVQLGTVRRHQKRYDEALNAYDEALKIFEDLGEPTSVAVIWHQMGMVHGEANRFEAAEQAYRQSLAINVQQNDAAGEGRSLIQLGNLYGEMGRLEDAVIFYRQAGDKFVEINDMANEGRARNNLADKLFKLKRYDEARQEILRAIECKKPYGHAATPWNVWSLLFDLEQAVGNREAANRARDQAIQLYLAYRRDGGENHELGGRLCHEFREALQENKTGKMATRLTELSAQPGIPPSLKALIPKLQALLAGSRDPGLAADPELLYTDAAEILFLLEELS